MASTATLGPAWTLPGSTPRAGWPRAALDVGTGSAGGRGRCTRSSRFISPASGRPGVIGRDR